MPWKEARVSNGVHGAIQLGYVLILVYTLCRYCEMLAPAAGKKVSKHLEAT